MSLQCYRSFCLWKRKETKTKTKEKHIYLQCIDRDILLETDGGTPFEAIHKYEPISLREIFVNFKTSPRNEDTVVDANREGM